MKLNFEITHEFVEFIPQEMKERTLYIAMEYGTASHKCFCGCGAEVVTPLSPTAWQISFDGERVSLIPSIGSWGLPCKSHYWIRRSSVEWSYPMSTAQIAAVKQRDKDDTLRYHGIPQHSTTEHKHIAPQSKGLWNRFISWFLK